MISIPTLQRVVLPSAGPWAMVDGSRAAATVHPRRLRILVVDDDRDQADSLATVLHLFGHEADIAYSGPVAVEQALAIEPEVVLCDLAMPGMDGFTVVKELRDLPALSETIFIAASGYGADGDCARARRAGFQFHLLKPLDLERLHQILAECLRR